MSFRRQLAKSSVRPPSATTAAVVRKMAGVEHFHGCAAPGCRVAYSCRCTTPEVNGRCHACRGVRRPVHEAYRDPRPCCAGSELVTATTSIATYLLAGPGPWFQCRTCARCHNHSGSTATNERGTR